MIRNKIRTRAPYSSMYEIHTVDKDIKEKGQKKTVRKSVTMFVTSAPCDKDNKLQVLPIDQLAGRPFMLNANGFPMNDIMLYETAQSASVAESVLHRIHVVNPNNIDQNLTPEEMFEQVVPANWSSPAEFSRCSRMFAEKYYARHPFAKNESAEPDNGKIQFEPENEPKVE